MFVDSHIHIIDPERFPFMPGAGYTPRSPAECGSFEQLEAVMAARGVSHGLLVQPSCYGNDNRAMLDAIGRSEGRLRGIAVVDTGISDTQLDRLSEAGIVGARFNLMQGDAQVFTRLDVAAFLTKLQARGWYLEVYADSARWAELAPRLADSGVKVIVDHWGGPDRAGGVAQDGFQVMLRAAQAAGNWTVKFSAAFRLSDAGPHYEDLSPFVAPLLDGFGSPNCVWGSDWPFINLTRRPNYADLQHALELWIHDAAVRAGILSGNPARLFGFGAASRAGT
ncbi:MAG: amidohydrolase [Xanthobacteraceae bacterium]